MRLSEGKSDTVGWVKKSFPEMMLIILRSKRSYNFHSKPLFLILLYTPLRRENWVSDIPSNGEVGESEFEYMSL